MILNVEEVSGRRCTHLKLQRCLEVRLKRRLYVSAGDSLDSVLSIDKFDRVDKIFQDKAKDTRRIQ